MKNLGMKFALIGVVVLCGIMAMVPPKEKLKAGIDLSGGTILVYEVKKEGLPPGFKMDELVTTLKRRLNPEGVFDIPIRKAGQYRVEIILPKASPEKVEEVKRLITDVGSLNFRILANRKHDSAAIDRALAPGGLKKPPARYQWARLGEIFSGTNPRFTKTAIVDARRNWAKNRYTGTRVEIVGKDSTGRDRTVVGEIKENTRDTLILKEPHGLASVASYRFDFTPSAIVGGDDAIVREEKAAAGEIDKYILVKIDRYNVTGKDLIDERQEHDEQLRPAVGFRFGHSGGRKFGNLTREHLPEEDGQFKYRLAIVLDGLVMSAPSINSEIRESGVIEGVRVDEVDHLINILKAGSLPATIDPNPVQEENVGPTLGEDTIRKGINAIMISMLIVPIFMIVYYHFVGMVAVFALVLNMVMLVGSMAFFQASFTLPGLAGLALTIGMAVDANVLIFERMREEKERGASMIQQIRNGFTRAWTTILDSNVSTMLSGVVLYAVGTEEVKGFALTLIIGLLWNLFTAVFVSRVVFDFWLQQGWLRKTTMMKIMDKTNIDFIGPRYYCIAGSLLVIVGGLIAFFARGEGMFNIDFTGGTLVTIRLNPEAEAIRKLASGRRSEFVREKAMKVLPDVTVETLNVGGDKASGIRFNIRTTELSQEKVQKSILKEFAGMLAQVEMKVSAGKPIPKTVESAQAKPGESAAEDSVDRFAGGVLYETTFNSPQPPARLNQLLRDILKEKKIANPETRFEVIDPSAPPGSTPEAPPKAEPWTLVVRTDLDPADMKAALDRLSVSIRENASLLFDRLENFSPLVAGETRTLALIATVSSWLIIIAYLWFRFKSLTYGLAAVIALVHDVLIALGAVAVSYWLAQIPGVNRYLMIEQFKIDLPMIAAFLTLIGFSVNDTIVIFDRIREIKGKSPDLTSKMINDAINQTLSRTILTTLTAWLVVIVLYIFGGEGLHGFAFTLVVGFISGTYSTIYIASPILIDWAGKKETPKPTREVASAAARR